MSAQTAQSRHAMLTRIALWLGVFSIVASIGAGALAYLSSHRALTAQLARSSELLAASVRSHGEDLVAQGAPVTEALTTAWAASHGAEQGLYLCFIGRDGKLNLHTRDASTIGVSVASLHAANPEEPPAVVQDLLRDKRSWSGENVTLGGAPQVVSFSYSKPLAGLVTVHVPQAVIEARARRGMLPWAYGIGFIALVLLPAALLLMQAASRRSERVLAAAHAEQSELTKRLLRSERLESIGRLAGSISHDFNNLLMVMQVGTENLRVESLSPGALQEVDEIEAAARKGADLVKQLLAFGKPRTGHQVLELSPMLGELHGLLQRAAGGIELKLKLDDELGKARADRTQLEQVLLNLVVNARDASADDSVIELTAERATLPQPKPDAGTPPERGRWVRISVRDHGTGMSPDVLEHLFEPFFTTKAQGKGTGLGLATAHAVIHQHGGRLTVSSRLGEGTTLNLYLPIISDTATDALSELTPAPNMRCTPRARVLLVEDQDDVRAALTRLIERCGHEVEAVPEATTARARFADHSKRRIELVVSDVTMPGERGDALAQDLIESDPFVRVLLGSGNEVTVEQRADNPRIGFLAKPFSRDALNAKLIELLTPQAQTLASSQAPGRWVSP